MVRTEMVQKLTRQRKPILVKGRGRRRVRIKLSPDSYFIREIDVPERRLLKSFSTRVIKLNKEISNKQIKEYNAFLALSAFGHNSNKEYPHKI
jgi:hypothetical protein